MRRPARVPRDLWRRAARARHRLLMLDYDGTLAPFRVDRMRAVPSPGILEKTRRIGSSRRTRLAIVSGRPVSELSRLLGRIPAHLLGEHGWESKAPGGRLMRHRLPAASARALQRAAMSAAARGWDSRLERKRFSLMLHTRGLPSGAARKMEAACAEIWIDETSRAGLVLRRAHGGIELRAPGHDKGTAVRELMASLPAGSLPVYVGDDETDEDAFAAVRSRGFGLLVSRARRRSRAAGRLASRRDLSVFLGRWIRSVEGGTLG